MAGYLLKQAADASLWPFTVAEVERVCYTGRNQ
jgi:hypothetical protein